MGRAPCCSKVGLNRGPWTPEEDMLLSKHIEAHGEGNWRALPKAAGLLRCGKSCRLRWVNYLRPNVKRGNISEDEEDLIIMLHALLGNRWSLIAARMPGRTDNEIKNYWNTHLSKKLASKGLDPKTHKPISSSSAKSSSSSGSKKKAEEESKSEDDDPQEAWETTMDLDTSSYSTGSCGEEDDQIHHRAVSVSLSGSAAAAPPKVCARLHKKRQMPVLSNLQTASPVSVSTIASAKDSKGSSEGAENVKQHPINNLGQSSKNDKNPKFDCPSPSSVLNVYSPTPSASNSGSNSNCDSPSSTAHQNHHLHHQSASLLLLDHDQQASDSDPHSQLVDWERLQCPQMQTEQMLEFIDDFLCNEDDQQQQQQQQLQSDLFKEDGAGSEFWESLGKIELPECSSVCQSDLWDGLNDFVPAAASVASIPAAATPIISNSSQSSAPHSHFLHDNISELLFCS